MFYSKGLKIEHNVPHKYFKLKPKNLKKIGTYFNKK